MTPEKTNTPSGQASNNVGGAPTSSNNSAATTAGGNTAASSAQGTSQGPATTTTTTTTTATTGGRHRFWNPDKVRLLHEMRNDGDHWEEIKDAIGAESVKACTIKYMRTYREMSGT